ncbi:hypothetical protein LTS18_011398, partial [Coniosporium uncinatum]
MKLGPDFKDFDIKVSSDPEVTIHGTQSGSGPPLLLLHGFPQTHLIWHKVAPQLASKYTVIALDLRGYGASSKPSNPSSPSNHNLYSKRSMAADCATAMQQLGHSRFF